MIVVRSAEDIRFEANSVVTVGTFDGMHLAHQAIVRTVVERARARKGRSVVVTFHPHPRQVLARDGRPIALLSTLEERVGVCESFGVDVLLVLEFTPAFSRLSAREFYESVVVKRIGVKEVVEGYDHHFGHNRGGGIEALQSFGKEFGFMVQTLDALYVERQLVSSSAIRAFLEEGKVAEASQLLGRPYAYSGLVWRGDGRGRKLGYPTANLRSGEPDKQVPQNGIYFVRVPMNDAIRYGMTSIGVRPTFYASGERTVEVNILDFDGDLYDQELRIEFLERLRDELKFSSAEELIAQMDRDKQQSLQLRQRYHKEQSPAVAQSN